MTPRPTVVGSSTTSYAFDDDDDDDNGQDDDIMALNMSIMHIDPHNTKLHTAADDLGFYQTEEEQTGVGEVLFSLTKEEVESFPDEQMPLRHYRAEDVRGVLFYMCVTVGRVQAFRLFVFPFHGWIWLVSFHFMTGGSNKESCFIGRSGNNGFIFDGWIDR
jgi:hypothetical protein